jgi:ATP-dependent DNA helicase RecQ
MFADSFAAPPAAKLSVGDSVRETLRRFQAGETVEQIARERGFAESTIYSHLVEAIGSGEKLELNKVISSEQERLIEAAFAKVTFGGLKEVKELLGDKVKYGQLRVFRAARNSHAPRG